MAMHIQGISLFSSQLDQPQPLISDLDKISNHNGNECSFYILMHTYKPTACIFRDLEESYFFFVSAWSSRVLTLRTAMCLTQMIVCCFSKAQFHLLPSELRGAEKQTGIREPYSLILLYPALNSPFFRFSGQ